MQGHWSSLARLKAPKDIKVNFDEAYGTAVNAKLPAAELSRICLEYATFADRQQSTMASSPEYERLKRIPAPDPVPMSASTTQRSTKSKSSRNTQVSSEDDAQNALFDFEAEQKTYIRTALRMFATSLQYSDNHDDALTRLVSLWLQCADDEVIQNAISGPLSRVPSFKFISLAPQLAARLDSPATPTTFSASVNTLITRVCLEHPFHALYQVITFAHGTEASAANRMKSSETSDGRQTAAIEIIQSIGAHSSRPRSIAAVRDMQRFVEAAIPWAYQKEKKDEKEARQTSYTLLPDQTLAKLINLTIPIPTIIPPISKEQDYAAVPRLARYRSKYSLLGGIHKPKKMAVYDSNGNQYFQIVRHRWNILITRMLTGSSRPTTKFVRTPSCSRSST